MATTGQLSRDVHVRLGVFEKRLFDLVNTVEKLQEEFLIYIESLAPRGALTAYWAEVDAEILAPEHVVENERLVALEKHMDSLTELAAQLLERLPTVATEA